MEKVGGYLSQMGTRKYAGQREKDRFCTTDIKCQVLSCKQPTSSQKGKETDTVGIDKRKRVWSMYLKLQLSDYEEPGEITGKEVSGYHRPLQLSSQHVIYSKPKVYPPTWSWHALGSR